MNSWDSNFISQKMQTNLCDIYFYNKSKKYKVSVLLNYFWTVRSNMDNFFGGVIWELENAYSN